MSQKLIDHNPDLGRLQGSGLDIEINSAYLLVHDIAYVNSKREVCRGTVVVPLTYETTEKIGVPPDHVAYFVGEVPCDADGQKLVHVVTASDTQKFGDITINHTFSAKPEVAFTNYYDKIISYVKILSHEALTRDSSTKVYTFKVRELGEGESIFNYPDTNSGRANIGGVSSKLADLKVGIIGLGGTGSYVLDFVAKTHVKEIHLFDKDTFLVHNAFRSPGAPSVEKINEQKTKTAYLSEIYSNMRKFIIPHETLITEDNLHELADLDFVFVCIDGDEIKDVIFTELLRLGKPFIDTGIGVLLIDGSLEGSVRTTLATNEKSDHLKERVALSSSGEDIYSKNIQIAELNAINAAQAVIKWKKFYGFYHDQKKEHNATYHVSTNRTVINEIHP